MFVKAFADAPADDVFVAETEGLAALRELGGVATPEVILADRELLVLSVLRPRPHNEIFWERFAHALARMRLSTIHPRFGWHRDGPVPATTHRDRSGRGTKFRRDCPTKRGAGGAIGVGSA
ncbi:fructosamine kinase family protein [Micromonospora pisi]|uniref:fructosamine kinase family protein n=1 Tax=Micromonospora pisi TaxID=589240 RepID=UPI001FE695D8|nr:fructosamine kinase family protein [Micromonospora pisi]